MPTYEYRCPEGHTFEQFQRMSDPPKADCPSCGKGAERLISAGGGFLFKGDGFYITDYRSDSYKAQAKKESGGASDASGASSATGSTSPASSASSASSD